VKPHLVWAEIDLNAIAHNLRELRRVTGSKARLMAVVKADGYGHGAVEVARTALEHGAEWLGVARLEEGILLRQVGLQVPILVFGYTPPERAEHLLDFDLRQCTYTLEAAAKYSQAALKRGEKIKIHLKIDTGMGRLGIMPEDLSKNVPEETSHEPIFKKVSAIVNLPGIEAEGIFTHFASSDSADKSNANKQLSVFLNVLAKLRTNGIEFSVRHAANSAALIEMPDSHLDLVRPGIAIYGLAPSDELDLTRVYLKPAMALKTCIIHLKRVPSNFSVSYGGTYSTSTPTVIATVPVGYADGFRRSLSSRGHMLVRGQRVPIVGRVCMDMTMLDVGSVRNIAVEDEVVIFGHQGHERITADDIARTLGTINYEVVSALTARVPKIHLRAEVPFSAFPAY
jgi:alanine racemase